MTLLDNSVIENELKKVIASVSRDKNLDESVVIDALEQAVIYAARRDLGATADLEAKYSKDIDKIELLQFRTVVEEPEDPSAEIGLEDARKLDPTIGLGDSLGVEIDYQRRFGRIAAQAAKQIIVQKVRDAERGQVYDEFKDRVGEIMSGHVRRIERNDVIVDLGRAEAIIPYREQVPTERYKPKDRVQGLIMEVRRASRGPQIIMSRAHPQFLIKLFEQVVTEIYDGIVTIESAARDPGMRSKIAVYSRDSAVDPVGACVGMKGARVQSVVAELNGEKIDIVLWDRDPAKLVCNALAPAVVNKVIVDEKNNTMEVIVADDQLSLAIGKRGQNVRLAAQISGWRLDIKSESKLREQLMVARDVLAEVPGLGVNRAEILVNEGIKTASELAKVSGRMLVRLLNVTIEEAEEIIANADDWAGDEPEDTTAGDEEEGTAAPDAHREAETSERDAARNDRVKLFMNLGGVGEATAFALADSGYATIGDIVADSVEEVSQKTGLALGVARTVQIAADRWMQAQVNKG
jgi:N utilization substance protein A